MPVCSLAQQGHSLVSVRSIDEEKHRHTGMIQRRFSAWKKMIHANEQQPVMAKLQATNDFFNQFLFEPENSEQGVVDYWKTPNEFVIDGGGDCEDFSIAKYFTLLALGLPVQSLRITYVKSLKLNKSHMVLAYYSTPEAEPLILDNLEAQILPASKRSDLMPVYSFNGEGLWLAQQRGKDRALGESRKLKKWKGLIQRMENKSN